MYQPISTFFRKSITSIQSKPKRVACVALMLVCAPLLPVLLPVFFIFSTAYSMVRKPQRQ